MGARRASTAEGDAAGVVEVDDGEWLAAWLLSPERRLPAVVIAWRPGHAEDHIAADRVAAEVDGWADVYRIESGRLTRAFEAALGSKRLAIFGDAGRVYPVGLDWTRDERRSPLRLTRDAGPTVAARRLVADARSLGPAVTVVESLRPEAAPLLSAVMEGVVGDGECALVRLADGRHATMFAEDVVPGVNLEWVFARGQKVVGRLDPSSRRFTPDVVRRELRPLKEYSSGQIVLALVVEASPDSATLRLWPGNDRVVAPEGVTSNMLDAVDQLLGPGDVVAARMTVRRGELGLSVLDVDEDELIAQAPALVEGGVPWLEADRHAHGRTATRRGAEAGQDLGPGWAAMPPAGEPGPLRERRELQEALASIEQLTARVGTAEDVAVARADAEGLREALEAAVRARQAVEDEADRLAAQTRLLQDERERLRRELAGLRSVVRSKVRRLDRSEKAADAVFEHFATGEQRFHHDVYCAWVQVVAAVDKQEVPCPGVGSYSLGTSFLDSLRHPHVAAHRDKALDAVVRILVNDRRYENALDLHRVRRGSGAGDPCVLRDEDAATLWRASAQRATAAALRLHFWRLPDGAVELEGVYPHDRGL